MRRILLNALCMGILLSAAAQNPNLSVHTLSNAASPNGVVNFWQYTPPNYNGVGLYPLIISLHGGGQAGESIAEINSVLGDGLPAAVNSGKDLVFSYTNGGVTTTAGFIMLAPQATRGEVGYWPTYYTDQMISYGIANLHVDPNRIFLVGFSNGGGGVWNYATSSPANAAKLAGIAPSSSSGGGSDFCNIGSQKVAVWAFHGGSDNTIPAQNDHQYTVNVNNCSPIIPAVDTIYSNENHGIYNSVVYNFTNSSHYPNVFQWMLRVNRTINPTADAAPVPIISMGTNTTLNLTTPVKTKDIILDGTSSFDDDIIMDYLWENTAVPGGISLTIDSTQWPRAHIAASTSQHPIAIGLNPGTYSFRLRVKDYLTSAIYNGINHTQFANLNIAVSYPASGFSAPVTDAGPSITIPSNQTSVTGRSGEAQPYSCTSCAVSGYNWRQISGPPATLGSYDGTQAYPAGDNNVSFNNLNSTTYAVYQFEFSATTQHGDIGRDTMTITKLGALPVTYSYFNGSNAGTKNTLNWATSTETNSARFDVQRSTDGIHFTTIGSVTAKGGANETRYSYDDNAAPAGVAYYRLSQVDKDGHSALSPTISITGAQTALYIDRYPNPVHDNLTLAVQGTINGKLKIVIADMQGKTVLQQELQKNIPQLKQTINVSSLQNGIYQMIITGGQEKQVTNFIKY